MKIKTSELTGAALDWATCKAAAMFDAYPQYASGTKFLRMWSGSSAKYVHPSTDWAQGGPIIERERIGVWHYQQNDWMASWRFDGRQIFGPTPLIAAMRCFVASKLGEVVDVPEELK